MFQFPPRKCSTLDTLTVQPVKEKKKKREHAGSQGGPVMNTSCVLPSSSFSLSLFSLLWAVIDLISSSLNWSHDSCCSDWASLTTHRHSSVMPSPIYLSICLCLLSLSLASGTKSTCCPHRATTARFAPACDYYHDCSHNFQSLLFLIFCNKILFFSFWGLNQHSESTVMMFLLSIS